MLWAFCKTGWSRRLVQDALQLLAAAFLPGRIIRSLVALRCGGNHFDFHIRSFWQGGNLDCGTGRGILFEIRSVNFVYGLKVGEISQENGCFDDVIKGQTFRS